MNHTPTCPLCGHNLVTLRIITINATHGYHDTETPQITQAQYYCPNCLATTTTTPT